MLSVSHPFVLKLADDDSESARAAIREAKAQWTHGKFLLQDWQIMRSEAEIELYVGDGAAAYDRLKRDEVPLDEEHAPQRAAAADLHASTPWGARRSPRSTPQGACGPTASPKRTSAPSRSAENRCRGPTSTPATLTACVKNAEGDREATLLALREAIALADAADMMLHAAAARHRLGLLLGGAEGALELQQAEEAMRAQDVRIPAKFAGLYVPGRWS